MSVKFLAQGNKQSLWANYESDMFYYQCTMSSNNDWNFDVTSHVHSKNCSVQRRLCYCIQTLISHSWIH